MNECQTHFKQIKEFEIYSHFMQKRDEIKIHDYCSVTNFIHFK